MKVKKISQNPKNCIGGLGCPAIYKTDRNSYVVVGKKIQNEKDIQSLSIGSDEDAVEIPKQILDQLKE